MKTCNTAASALLPIFLLAGCANPGQLRESGGNAALYHQFQAFDARTGRALNFENVVSMAQNADVVLFGEEHSNAVCNALEAQLLAAMHARGRPVSLAMEFFERDTQSSLDAYLEGRTDEAAFRESARQKKAYLTSHRPMVEFCRENSIPVIAANAPWRLMRALGKSGLTFAEYRETVDHADRPWLPRESELLEGPYRERFKAAMSHHGAPTPSPATQPTSESAQPAESNADSPTVVASDTESAETTTSAPSPDTDASPSEETSAMPQSQPADNSPPPGHGTHGHNPHAASQPAESKPSADEMLTKAYRAQSLWDDSMAESVGDHRARYGNRRVMLVVGVFHVEREGGLWTKLKRCRPNDTVVTIVFRGAQPPFTFDEDDRGAGDVVIYGIAPPEDEEPGAAVTAPNATSQPASRPAEESK